MNKLNKMILGFLCALMVFPVSPLSVSAEEISTEKRDGYTAWSDDASLASRPGVISQKMYRYSDLETMSLCESTDGKCEIVEDVKVRYIDTPMRVMANGKWLDYDPDSYGKASGVEGFLTGNKWGLKGDGKVYGHLNAGGVLELYDGNGASEYGAYCRSGECYNFNGDCSQFANAATIDVNWSLPSARITDGTALSTSVTGVYSHGYTNHGYRIRIEGSKSGEVIEYNKEGNGSCGVTGVNNKLCIGTTLYNATHNIVYGSLSEDAIGTEGTGHLVFQTRRGGPGGHGGWINVGTPWMAYLEEGYTSYGYITELWVVERTYFVDIYNTGLGTEVSVDSRFIKDGSISISKKWGKWSSWQSEPIVPSDNRKVEEKTFYAAPIQYSIVYDLNGGDMKGDANMDGYVNTSDLTLYLNYASGGHITSMSLTNADMDGNGTVTAVDSSILSSRVKATYGSEFSTDVPFKEGYIFDGWTITTSDSSTKLTGQKQNVFKDLAKSEGALVTFKAEWKKISTGIAFDLGGGAWKDGLTPITSMEHDKVYTLSKIPEREGYLFKGWNVEGVNGDGYISPYSNANEISRIPVYGYKKATYEIKNVKTDGKETTYSPWFRYVYKYNYNHKEEYSSTDFTINDTKAKDGTVWSKHLDGWHLTRFVSDIDMARQPQWDNYYQPKVDVRDDSGKLFTGQSRNSSVLVNGDWRGDVVIRGTLYMYAYGETGSGRNWTGSGGSNYIEYYRITSKISNWVFDASGITDATSINSINATGYVLPTWSAATGWRLTGPYADDQNTMAVSANLVFHSNGGHLISSSNAATLLCRQYERAGYTFTGFNTKADGTGTSYPSSTKISSLPIKEGEDFHLYAQWKKNEKPNNFLFDKVENRKVNALSGLEYMESYLYTMRNLRVDGGDVKFVAEWILREYTFKIDPNTGTINGSSAVINASPSLLYGSDRWSTIPVAVKPGYKLEGYYTSKTAGEKVYDSSGKAINGTYWKDGKYNFDGNLSVYAHWIDVEPPVITIKNYDPAIYNPDGTPNFTNQNVKVTFDVTDEGSGLSKVELVHNGVSVSSLAELDGEKLVTLIYTATTRILDSDNYYIKATDKSGNVSYKKLVIPNIDKQKPGIDESEGYLRCGMAMNGNDSVTLKVSDDYSGIREWSYKVDYRNMFGDTTEGPWINGTESLTAEINVPESTIANVSVRAMDNAGNINIIGSCPLTFNKVYSATTTLSDYDYVFGLYDSLYGRGAAVTDAIASDFLNYLSSDGNETSKSALRYMQTLVLEGQSKAEALQSFMTIFRYDRH